MGPITGLDRAGTRKITCLCLESNPGRPPHTLITTLIHYGASCRYGLQLMQSLRFCSAKGYGFFDSLSQLDCCGARGYSRRRVKYSSLSNAEAKNTLSSTPLIRLHDALPRFCLLRDAVPVMAKNNSEIFINLQVFNPRLSKNDSVMPPVHLYVCKPI